MITVLHIFRISLDLDFAFSQFGWFWVCVMKYDWADSFTDTQWMTLVLLIALLGHLITLHLQWGGNLGDLQFGLFLDVV